MDTGVWIIAAMLLAVALYPVVWLLVRSYLNWRGTRVVTCPETKQFAAVEVDARGAAVSGLFGKPALRLSDCSRWPERWDCGQECVRQIEAAPADCLVRVMLEKWYAGKSCVCCGKSLHEMNWLQHRPALRTPEGRTLEWWEINAEQIPEALRTHQPVCWDCHVDQTFRRLFPDPATDRPPKEPPRKQAA
ncbi:MAG TPA: hypothetical protein VEU62_13820 [Bryobacterales bacterium]|nr:hypothetical protein [Bryobacterales bacterium]